jgi:Tat protein secretion system quality control protein TatD with DNase activity
MDNDLIEKINKYFDILSIKSVKELEFIRVGSSNDGGYLLVNDLNKNDFLISCGIGNNFDFEMQLSEKEIAMHCYDNSINMLPRIINNSLFYKLSIGYDIFLNEMVEKTPKEKDLILKMDIEGSE